MFFSRIIKSGLIDIFIFSLFFGSRSSWSLLSPEAQRAACQVSSRPWVTTRVTPSVVEGSFEPVRTLFREWIARYCFSLVVITFPVIRTDSFSSFGSCRSLSLILFPLPYSFREKKEDIIAGRIDASQGVADLLASVIVVEEQSEAWFARFESDISKYVLLG